MQQERDNIPRYDAQPLEDDDGIQNKIQPNIFERLRTGYGFVDFFFLREKKARPQSIRSSSSMRFEISG